MSPILNSILVLSGSGILIAAVLYLVAKKFKVYEDPRIDEVEKILPGANCGACGSAGCHAFAERLVGSDEENFAKCFCPVGGNNTMKTVASYLGFAASDKEKTIAVLRCNGSKKNAPQKVKYEGTKSCRLAHMTFAGESGCPYGCLGFGDCVEVCKFGALSIDEETGLPVVDEEKCTSCGACVAKCPRNLFEIRPAGKNNKRIYVACMNQEKGATARKNCVAACIGCGKCSKVYETDAIVVNNNLSYISPKVDIENYGSQIVGCCPTGAIIGVGIASEKTEKIIKDKEV
ncbi:MAG: RnfABCDGE type electron transport complex subunit B [Alphaproteobacteria bacterium]